MDSTRYIQDAAQVPQLIRNIAATLAAMKRSHIKRVWQQCYDDLMTEQSETRLKKAPKAQRKFEEATALTPALNLQLEGSGYNPDNEKDQDTTFSALGAFEKPPGKTNWLVGSGQSSSRLTTGVLWMINGVNISKDLADRRSQVMLALEQLKTPDMLPLRNFIYTSKVLQDVMSIDHWTAAAESWQTEYECIVDEAELTPVFEFVVHMHAKTTLLQAVARTRRIDPTEPTNPLHAIIENHLRTTVLWSTTTDVPGQLRQQQASKRQALQQPSRSPSDPICLSDRSGRGISSASRARDAMQKQYVDNLQAFKGKLWTVTWGKVVDIEIRSHVLSLKKESSLQSFVIDDAKTVIQLFTGKDKEEVAQVLEECGDEEQDTKDAQAFVVKYLSTPKATRSALGRGWLSSSEKDDALDEDRQDRLFKAIHDIYTVCKCCAFHLPLEEKESWYMTTLWSFLLPFLNEGNALVYSPEEAMSEASVLRKNATRRPAGTMARLEFGGIKAAKTDEGAQSTKALMDTRKMAKLLKDMHDCIVSKTDDANALYELETFGLQISRTKMTIYRLRKIRVDGPHYQLVNHGSYLFPPVWDERGLSAAAIIRLLTTLVGSVRARGIYSNTRLSWFFHYG
ncbi:hypothetical protein BGX30_002317 [Mortierella sp. GBA39]|nr:hypothetical protein BGX30_002317 [Mortierella sp. GBA39]